jgi:hypothetical protein
MPLIAGTRKTLLQLTEQRYLQIDTEEQIRHIALMGLMMICTSLMPVSTMDGMDGLDEQNEKQTGK